MKNKMKTKTPIEDNQMHEEKKWLRREILLILKRDIVEVTSPLHPAPCWIPRCRIDKTGAVINKPLPAKFRGVTVDLHRLAQAYNDGEIPSLGRMSTHKCDRKCCCNPEHLQNGNHESNKNDAIERGLIKRGAAHPAYLHPEIVKSGENAWNAGLTDIEASAVKWCLANTTEWYSSAVEKCYNQVTALAVYYHATVPVIRQIRSERSWKKAPARRPAVLPFSDREPTGTPPPRAYRCKRILSDENVADILMGAVGCSNLPRYIGRRAKEFIVCRKTILDVLKRKTHRNVCPDIPPIDYDAHWKERLTARDVQQMRNTYVALKGKFYKKGLVAALARHFDVSISYAHQIVTNLTRVDVPDDPNVPTIPLAELHFKELTKRGEDNTLAKLTDAKVFEILRRVDSGETQSAVAREFQISAALCSRIVLGKTWRHVYEKFQQQRKEGGESK